MTELMTDREPTFNEIPKFKHWECQPDPIVSVAAKLIFEQRSKPQQPLEPEKNQIQEGILLLPKWENYLILKLGQRRGVRDLLPRGASYHNVSFGIAELRKPDNSILATRVSIKPFDLPEKAVHDATVNSIVLDRGFSTTNPICVVIGSKNSYVLSIAKEGVQALDTEPWHQFSPKYPELQPHFFHRLQQVAEVLADLNAKGINHGDAKLRNYWSTPAGAIEPFDWESATIFPNPPSAENLITISRDDLMSLFRSLQVTKSGVAFMQGTAESKNQQFKELIFQHYFQRLLNQLIETNNEELINSLAEIEHFF